MPGLAHNPWGFAVFVFLLESLTIADTTPNQMANYLALVSLFGLVVLSHD